MKKIIIVTGGNRGIGLEIVKQLANLGHQVILAARNAKEGQKQAKLLFEKGLDVQFKQLDLADSLSIEAFAKQLYTDFSRIDVLINNAGVFIDKQYASTNVPMDIVKQTMQINLYGAMDLSKTILNLLKGSTSGRIINMSSGLGAMGEMAGGHTAYRLSKVGLNAFTKIFAADLADTNIRVNSMCPGWVQTEMGGEGAPRTVEQGAETAVWLATQDKIPTGKFFRDKKEIDW